MEVRKLTDTLGCMVTGVSPEEIVSSGERAHAIAGLLDAHGVVLVRPPGDGGAAGLSPAQVRQAYRNVHEARFGHEVQLEIPPERPPASATNIRGCSFPGHPESCTLGYAEAIHDWFGVTGALAPTAFWLEKGSQYHHDGGFSAASPVPPLLVAMVCEEVPKASVGTLMRFGNDERIVPAGATMFIPTRAATVFAAATDPAVELRARRLRAVYRESFGRVNDSDEERFPIMSETFLSPVRQSPVCTAGAKRKTTGYKSNTTMVGLTSPAEPGDIPRLDEMRHMLVEKDLDGVEFIIVHSVALHCFEELQEDGETWRPMAFEDSVAFIETLLAPVAVKPLVIDWRRGDLLFFDNLRCQHSVTPTDAFTVPGKRRLMIRTSMQPSVNVLDQVIG